MKTTQKHHTQTIPINTTLDDNDDYHHDDVADNDRSLLLLLLEYMLSHLHYHEYDER